MSWHIYTGTEEDWQKNFLKSKNHYRQSFHWGKYKSLMNWKILRLEKIDDIGKKTLVQITYKKKFLFCAAYIPGDIAGDINQLNENFKKKIMEVTNSKFLYIRLDSNNIKYKEESSIFKKNKWHKPLHREHVSKSIDCNIEVDTDEIIKKSSNDWKKNYKRSLNKFNNNNLNIQITNKPNPKDLVLISTIMNKNKKIFVPHGKKEFLYLSENLSQNTLFAIVYSSEGVPLAYRGMIYYDDRAWDLGAATTSEGRNLLASYYLTIELIKKSRSLGVKNYNFGAIDELNKPGVYHFKKGIGQNEFKYSGEWEWSNLPLMRFIINISIKLLMSDRLRKIIPYINNLKF
jgi:lipid II:glycine glycyltransferase (peptidoglycan interpeptide bridge formation enzyme)